MVEVGEITLRDAFRSDVDRVHAARQGDLQAFNDLVLAYQDGLYQWVYYLVGDSAQAEDLTQSVFLTAYEKLHTFRGDSFRAWLFRIARNRSYDLLRRRRSHPMISLDQTASEDDDREMLDNLPDEAPDPEKLVERREQKQAIQLLLDRLPADHRHALELVDMNELDYQEAAFVLGIPMGTLKSRLARARAKFSDLAVASGLLPVLGV